MFTYIGSLVNANKTMSKLEHVISQRDDNATRRSAVTSIMQLAQTHNCAACVFDWI
jgi:hypothetical protein